MTTTRALRDLATVIIGTMMMVTLLLALVGCNQAFPGLRFAPGEDLKASAAAAHQLANVAASDGIPPGSDAASTMRRASSALAAHVGPPGEPVDTSPLTPPAIREAWPTRARQVEALQTKYRITNATWTAMAESLTDLLDHEDSTIAPEIASVLRTLRDGRAMSAAIEVPAMPEMTAAERESVAAASAALGRATEAATRAGNRRPSVTEVVDTGIDEVAWWVAALGLGGTGIGGTILGVKKAKDARAARGELALTQHDLANAEHGRQYAVASADEQERTTETLVATIDAIRRAIGETDAPRSIVDAVLEVQDSNVRETVRRAKKAIDTQKNAG